MQVFLKQNNNVIFHVGNYKSRYTNVCWKQKNLPQYGYPLLEY